MWISLILCAYVALIAAAHSTIDASSVDQDRIAMKIERELVRRMAELTKPIGDGEEALMRKYAHPPRPPRTKSHAPPPRSPQRPNKYSRPAAPIGKKKLSNKSKLRFKPRFPSEPTGSPRLRSRPTAKPGLRSDPGEKLVSRLRSTGRQGLRSELAEKQVLHSGQGSPAISSKPALREKPYWKWLNNWEEYNLKIKIDCDQIMYQTRDRMKALDSIFKRNARSLAFRVSLAYTRVDTKLVKILTNLMYIRKPLRRWKTNNVFWRTFNFQRSLNYYSHTFQHYFDVYYLVERIKTVYQALQKKRDQVIPPRVKEALEIRDN